MEDMLAYAVMVFILLIVIWDFERKLNKNKKYIGDKGEAMVYDKLNYLGASYTIQNDVHIGSVQIDHLVINNEVHACFVIETKFWGGFITGSREDNYWQQNKNGEIKYFKNPIKQNDCHCKVIRNRYPEYKVYSIVVFIKNRNVPHLKNIISESEILNYIKCISAKLELAKQKPLP